MARKSAGAPPPRLCSSPPFVRLSRPTCCAAVAPSGVFLCAQPLFCRSTAAGAGETAWKAASAGFQSAVPHTAFFLLLCSLPSPAVASTGQPHPEPWRRRPQGDRPPTAVRAPEQQREQTGKGVWARKSSTFSDCFSASPPFSSSLSLSPSPPLSLCRARPHALPLPLTLLRGFLPPWKLRFSSPSCPCLADGHAVAPSRPPCSATSPRRVALQRAHRP